MTASGGRPALFVQPEFGFFSNSDPGPVRRSKPPRLHSSRVYFSEYAGAVADDEWQPWTNERGEAVLQFRHSRQGKLAVVNSGRGRGFRICPTCGYAELAPFRRAGPRRKAHSTAWGRPCSARLAEPKHLGHEFLTDVLELRFTHLPSEALSRSLWLSVLYAILEGASGALGIERSDIDGCLYPRGAAARPPSLILYDANPGGAGHAKRVGEDLGTTLREAARRVRHCECDESTACYVCLKGYGNQYCHHMLSRGLARQCLGELLGGA